MTPYQKGKLGAAASVKKLNREIFVNVEMADGKVVPVSLEKVLERKVQFRKINQYK